MHDRGLDAVDGLDGLRQLALERPLVGDLLLEVAARHALLVQERVPGGVALPRRQPLARERDPLLVDVGLRDEDGLAAVGELVRLPGVAEGGGDGGGVGRTEPREQRRVRRRGDPPDEEDPTDEHDEGRDPRHDPLPDSEVGEHLSAAGEEGLGVGAGHTGILMISVKASTALLRTATVSWVATAASLAAMV